MENLQTMQAGQSQRLEDAQSRWEKEAALLEERIAVLKVERKRRGYSPPPDSGKEEVDRIVDSLRETIPSMEEELKVISSQWESKWEEVGKSITDWQEAVIQDIETKIAILKQELPDKSQMEEWEKKIDILQEEGERLKDYLTKLKEEKSETLQEEQERLNKLEEEVLWEKELAAYQKEMEQVVGTIKSQVEELATSLSSVENAWGKLRPIVANGGKKVEVL